MTTEITIKNAKLTRKFGYGLSTTPTGNGTGIARPRHPDYTGTLNQVNRAVSNSRDWPYTDTNVFTNSAVFYGNKRIEAVWKFTYISGDYSENWREDNSVYDYAWVTRPSLDDLIEAIAEDGSLELRLED